MAWVKAASLEDLREKPLVLKYPPRQIAVFSVNGGVFAIDNRCPHEGYPLAVGTVSPDCVLTCNWHNWKFRLEDGKCTMGGDNVRSYPARLQNGEVWIDLTPPSPEVIQRQILRGLRTAFDERDFGRVCREIARLHFEGLDPKDAVRQAIAWSYDHFEWGMWDGHALAGTADWLMLAETFGDDFELQLVCLAEAVDHMAFDCIRRPVSPFAELGDAFERNAFLTAVEAEQLPRVEGMVARALADGHHWHDIEEAFVIAVFDHYYDFGHPVIYMTKIRELVSRLGPSIERPVLLAFTRHLIFATREDLIPEFKDYNAMLQALPAALQSSSVQTPLEVPFAFSQKKVSTWLSESLASHSALDVYDALLTGLAQNMLHYDTTYGTSYERNVDDNQSWLAFTHGITFASAVRILCTKYPQLWRQGLLQMACFLGRNAHYLDKTVDENAWKVSDSAAFITEAHERLVDHGINEPIFAVHLLKTTLAVEAELPLASPRCREALLASLNRFLHSSLKIKHVRRAARQAITLVARDF